MFYFKAQKETRKISVFSLSDDSDEAAELELASLELELALEDSFLA